MNKLLPLETPDFSHTDPSQIELAETNSEAIYIHPESEVGLALAEGIADIEAGRVIVVDDFGKFLDDIWQEALKQHQE